MELTEVISEPTQASLASGADKAIANLCDSEVLAGCIEVEIAIERMPSRP